MKHASSPKAFSIVFALGITLLLCFMGLYLLEYMVPYSRNVKGIEFASQAFYESYAGVEDAMYLHSQNTIGYQTGISLSPSIQEEYSYTIIGNGRFSPRQGVGEGTSEYNTDYNKLSQSEPAQFMIGNGRLNGGGNSLRLSLKIPDISPGSLEQLSNTGNMVLWQLSSSGQSLTAGSLINDTQINATFTGQLYVTSRTGTLLNGSVSNLKDFYDQYCNEFGEECVLKLSLISPMYSNLPGNPRIPYLEYQLRASPDIPLREAVIQTQGKSYGFLKKLRVKIPQLTTNSAFDFTVFQ